jgi:heme-degrading monooxygenase HmoA
MILEHADIRIDPAKAAEFEAAIQRGASTVIAQAKGFKGYKVNRSIESPGRYILNIYWDTLEDHTVGFRQSPAFAEWRAIVGPFFVQPPVVEPMAGGYFFRISVDLPKRLSIRSTASSAVRLRTSSAGLSSITSSDASRPVSAIISMQSCASR